MIFTEIDLKGAFLVNIETKEDERGFFGRTYCRNEFAAMHIDFSIAQTNLSFNKNKGTLRGMHMQKSPYKEAKLIQCISGSLYDVIIDMREDSPTLHKWTGTTLTAQNNTLLYIPEGFAHGFLTLEDDTRILYFMSEFYTPGAEQAFRWSDPFFNISWPLEPQVMSEKDRVNPLYR